MIVCPKCKSEIDADSLYCDQCGDALKICPQCQSLSRGKKCSKCGSAVTLKAGEAATPDEIVKESLFMVNAPQGVRLALIDGGIIGRKQGDYLSVFSSQMYVSGTHAKFSLDKQTGQWSITDLESTNGTYVNDTLLAPKVPCNIGKGDILKFAILEFLIE